LGALSLIHEPAVIGSESIVHRPSPNVQPAATRKRPRRPTRGRGIEPLRRGSCFREVSTLTASLDGIAPYKRKQLVPAGNSLERGRAWLAEIERPDVEGQLSQV